MKYIYSILLILLFYIKGLSATNIFIERNVTRSDIPEESNFATERGKLAAVISKDHGNKNFTFKVSFIDPSPYPWYSQWLVDIWNRVVGEGEEKPADAEILFTLSEEDKWKYEDIKLSKDLAENHLLPKVMGYIKQYVIANETDVNTIIKKWINVLSQALDKKWLKALETQSDAFAKRPIYYRENAGWGPMAYYEFIPYQDTQKDTLIIGKDTLITADYIIKQLEDKADRFQIIPKDFQSILHPNFKGSNNDGRYTYLKQVKNTLESYGKYNSILEVSKWAIKDSKNWELSLSPLGTGYKDKDLITDHLYMERRSVKKGEKMPTMAWRQNYGPWQATRCNVFAGDFSEEILILPTYPWGTKNCNADSIYKKLPTLPTFIELDWNEVWKYTNAGFPVYIVTPKLDKLPAGHIAIAFKIDSDKLDDIEKPSTARDIGKVVQAGNDEEKFGILNLSNALSEKYFDVKDCKAKAYLFLGHIKN